MGLENGQFREDYLSQGKYRLWVIDTGCVVTGFHMSIRLIDYMDLFP